MLTPDFITIEPIPVLYVRKTGHYLESTDRAWDAIVAYADRHDLYGKIEARYGIAYDNPDNTEEDKLRYDACVKLKPGHTSDPEGEVCEKSIEGGKYARFMHEGPYETLDVTYNKIGDWTVQSGVRLRNHPVFQKYLDLDPRGIDPKALRTEIYVPVES